MGRRAFLAAGVGLAGASAAAAQAPLSPASINPEATVRDWSGATPSRYPDPDIIAVDPRFNPYIIFNTPMRRHFTGALWSEGPAWNGVGRYLVWSDVADNLQRRT